MSKTTAHYIFCLALAVIVFHWKALLTDQYTALFGSEAVNQTYAWLHFWLRSVWHGHLPLWDPYTFGGRPFAGETQTGAWYPLHLLFALAPFNSSGVISPRVYHEYLAINRFLGAVFMFALLRELRRSHLAAFIGACAFSMGGLMKDMPWPHQLEACIWMPASLLFLVRSFRAISRRRALLEASLAGLSLGLSILTGGIQFAMIAAICVFLAGLWYGATNPAAWPRVGVVLAVIVVTTGAVGAAQLVPSAEYGLHALRWIKGGTFPMSDKIPYGRMDPGTWPSSIFTVLFPFAGPNTGGETWTIYVGTLPFFLALAALWKWRSGIWVRFLAGIAVLGFLYALGEFSPLNGILYAIVPFRWSNREPPRFLFLTCFAIAALSSFGLDALLEQALPRERFTPILKWIAIAAAALLIVPGLFIPSVLSIFTSLNLLLILATCAWGCYLLRNPPSRSASLLLVAFVLFDLGAFHWSVKDKGELAKTGDSYEQAMSLARPAAFLRKLPGPNRVRISGEPAPSVGDIFEVQTFWGGGVTALKDFSKLSVREDLLNVRYRIKPASTADPGAIYQDAYWKIYHDDAAFPRAWIVHEANVVSSDDDTYARITDGSIDPRRVALIQEPLHQTLDEAASGDILHFTSYEPDSITLEVQAAGNGVLVLSEIYYPGWRATVNGGDAEVLRVDGGLRGILLKRGTNHVVLTYVPVGQYAGVLVSLIAFLFCGWCGFRMLRDTSTTPVPTPLTIS
ncbi:MAG TPA: YfhO family protein [Bryobacteraceae bacterium]